MQDYFRIILPLTCEAKGYGHKGKNPSGRFLLESRSDAGKMIIWVQDLKPDMLYKVFLLFGNGNGNGNGNRNGNGNGMKSRPVCALSVGKNGKGEARYYFSPSEMDMEKCLGVAVRHNDVLALCGYREDVKAGDNWGNNWIEEAEEVEEVGEVREIDEVGEIEDSSNEGYSIEGYSIGDSSNEDYSIKDYSNQDYPTKDSPAEEDEAYDPPPPDPEKGLSDQFKEEVEAILISHTHMHPFQKQNRKVAWVRISLDENLSLPNHICDLLYDPFVEKAYMRYSHLILGKALDDGPKRYYIGVPALYDAKDKIIGFRQFKCSEDTPPKEGDYGYWLIFMS